MEKIKANIVFKEADNKVIELTKMELIALTASKMIGTDGKYYKINNIIFEDLSHLDKENEITIVLSEDCYPL